MTLRRGFKSEAHGHARRLREELGLGVAAPLSPWKLAEHLAIPVIPVSRFRPELPDQVEHITVTDSGAFSAATICRRYRRLIVINDAHHPNRQASSLAHEVAHIILWHTPAQAFGKDGVREWNPTQEREAEWLGAALLISDEAALDTVAKRMSLSAAAAFYGVSEDMVVFRVRVTGARIRVARANEYRPFA